MAKRPSRQAPNDDLPKVKVNKETLRQTMQLFGYLKPYRWAFLAGLALLSISAVITLAFPRVTGDLVNSATGSLSRYDRNTLALFLIGILAVQGIFSFFRVLVFAYVSENTLRDIRFDLYRKLIGLPTGFYEQRRVGELTSRITSDVGQLADVLSFTLAEFVRQVVTIIVGVGVIFYTSWQLSLVMLTSFPLILAAAALFGKFIRKLSKQVTDELGAANTIADESMHGIATVKSFTNEGYELGRYGAKLRTVTNLALRAARFRGGFISFVIFSVFGGIVLVMWYGLGLVESGQLGIGDLVSFVLYTFFIGAAGMGLGDLYSQLQKTAGASQRILEILGEKSEIAVEEGKTPEAGHFLEGRVDFEDVRFRYPARPDVEVLRGIDFSLKPGQVTALVGQSGAGKSTIAQLLMRFHAPTEGTIRIDGRDTNCIDLHLLRSQIGIVPQEVLLFGGSLRENIEYGKPGASLAEIREAARRANALHFIESFPEGFDTVVGERGIKLSGGQRQRIAIARALLKDPAILILDEATNALDTESEALVQDALNELMRGRTTLVIAHRLHTIRNADQILVIADGQVAEQGTHTELALNEGRYAALLRADRTHDDASPVQQAVSLS